MGLYDDNTVQDSDVIVTLYLTNHCEYSRIHFTGTCLNVFTYLELGKRHFISRIVYFFNHLQLYNYNPFCVYKQPKYIKKIIIIENKFVTDIVSNIIKYIYI